MYKLQYLTVHRNVARALTIVSVVYSYLFFVRSGPPEEQFSVKYLLYSGTIAAVLNSGLWLSTTKWGARRRMRVFVLLLPILTAVPMMIWYFDQQLIGWLLISVTLWSFWIVARREHLSNATA